VVAVFSHELEEVQDLRASEVSMLETTEGSQAKVGIAAQMAVSAMATSKMSLSEREEFKAKFMSVAAAIKTPKIRSDVLLAERMASKVIAQASSKEQGSGLDLIFRKLNELDAEIKFEQKTALAAITQKRDEATSEIEGETSTIDNAMKIKRENAQANKDSHAMILEARRLWYESRAQESGPGGIHEQLLAMQADRQEATEIIQAEVDERNKAIDVLVKALFLVCERFNRFKNTALCVSIKTQPDVAEPDRYETKEPDEAEEETKLTHKKETPFDAAWKEQEEKDIELEGALCPESPDSCPAEEALNGDMEVTNKKKFDGTFYKEFTDQPTKNQCAHKCSMEGQCQAFVFVNDGTVCKLSEMSPSADAINDDECCAIGVRAGDSGDDDADDGMEAEELLELGEDVEVDAQADVAHLHKIALKTQLPSRYAVPLEELVLATKAGVGAKKRKNIVQIIIQVIDETRMQQAEAKSNHQDKLDGWYDESWVKKGALDNERDQQNAQWAKWQQERSNIEQRILESEEQRKTMDASLESRRMIEDRVEEDNRVYGIEESLRGEDLENLAKLRSLLRALYDSTKPQGCPRTGGVLCTDKVAGWCVFAEPSPSRVQRCSCNTGFYGDACQFRMCPGNGDVLYKHDDEGVCSNRGTGQVGGKGCDNSVGKCSCDVDFYHGPENKCEYRHAPPSKYESDGDNYLNQDGTIDDQCSSRGVVDKKRGICKCNGVPTPFWGVAPNPVQVNGACETKKCPNSNGISYPFTSGNACNGHGACIPESGKCVCEQPYFGLSCESTNCPNDCSGKGQCNTNTGKCACSQDPIKYSGPSCEFMDCPAGCNAPAGECNRNDGKCVCKMGYTGEECQLSSRCTARSLNTPEANWWTVWDKPGWIACPEGQLLYALKRGTCSALSCLDTGSCAAGCQGDSYIYQIRHCYHDLGWYNSFDVAGWSKCLPDYFVSGLYRTCESLYCLQMAKCCSLKEARWAQCGNALWSNSMKNLGWSRLGDAGSHAFITGFSRGKGQNLKALDSASYCGFVRGY
jgi:hypothetical protein